MQLYNLYDNFIKSVTQLLFTEIIFKNVNEHEEDLFFVLLQEINSLKMTEINMRIMFA